MGLAISCVEIDKGLGRMNVAQKNIDQRMSLAYEGYGQQASIPVPHRVGPNIRNVII